MNNQLKAGAIIALGIVIAVIVWVYFSPYQSCVRATIAYRSQDPNGYSPAEIAEGAKMECAHR
jgi:hypothetical protein